MASGVGTYFGWYADDTSEMVLQDLLNDQGYDHPQVYVDAFDITPNSPVAELPVTLMDLHLSSMSEMPFDPAHWDLDGNYIP